MCIQKHFGNNCALLELILTVFIEGLVKYTRQGENLLAFFVNDRRQKFLYKTAVQIKFTVECFSTSRVFHEVNSDYRL